MNSMTNEMLNMNTETVKLDTIPLPISRIGLGTWVIGGWMWGGSN